jgi:hypothetical protein
MHQPPPLLPCVFWTETYVYEHSLTLLNLGSEGEGSMYLRNVGSIAHICIVHGVNIVLVCVSRICKQNIFLVSPLRHSDACVSSSHTEARCVP